MWDASGGTRLLRLAGHQGIVTSVAWSPDDRWLASGSGSRDRGELFVWDARSGERVHALVGHPGVVSALTWAPSGDLLVSGGSNGKLRWWDVQSGECLRVQEAHQGMVQALKVSPDGRTLASCGDDGVIAFWDWHSGEALRRLRRDRPYERLNMTGIQGLTQAQKATLRALGQWRTRLRPAPSMLPSSGHHSFMAPHERADPGGNAGEGACPTCS